MGLRRVRFAEEATPAGKQVWHQGDGAEMLSQVDGSGRVQQQELCFRGMVVSWRSKEGVRTGLAETDEAGHRDAAQLVRFHGSPQVNVLQDACDLLAKVKGDDAYLAHLHNVLARTLDGILGSGTHTVTRPPEAPRGAAGKSVSVWARLFGKKS